MFDHQIMKLELQGTASHSLRGDSSVFQETVQTYYRRYLKGYVQFGSLMGNHFYLVGSNTINRCLNSSYPQTEVSRSQVRVVSHETELSRLSLSFHDSVSSRLEMSVG